MHTVSIEADATYAYDEARRRFHEVCPSCGRERSGPGSSCRCGHSFDRRKRGFFVSHWTPASLEIAFPPRCPHCLGPAERTRRLWRGQVTGGGARRHGGGPVQTNIALDVPVCRRVRSPLLLGFLQLVAVFFLIAIGLGVIFQRWDRVPLATGLVGVVVVALLVVAVVWLHRAASWLRFVRFDHRSFRLKARRREYAVELARLNGGRVLDGFLGR